MEFGREKAYPPGLSRQKPRALASVKMCAFCCLGLQAWTSASASAANKGSQLFPSSFPSSFLGTPTWTLETNLTTDRLRESQFHYGPCAYESFPKRREGRRHRERKLVYHLKLNQGKVAPGLWVKEARTGVEVKEDLWPVALSCYAHKTSKVRWVVCRSISLYKCSVLYVRLLWKGAINTQFSPFLGSKDISPHYCLLSLLVINCH